MYRFLLTIFVVLLLPTLLSCDSPEEAGLSGHLYFAAGNYVGQFDLRSGASTIVANRGNNSIRRISPFGRDRLLLSEEWTVNRRNVSVISSMDLKSGRADALVSGIHAIYLPDHKAIIYDDGSRLHVKPLRRNSGLNAEIASHGLNDVTAILGVSRDTVLFQLESSGRRAIRSYNVVTQESQQHDELASLCSLTSAVWIDESERLACIVRVTATEPYELVLAALEGTIERRFALPDGGLFHVLTYVPGQDALILTERRETMLGSAQRNAAWMLHVPSGDVHRLVRDQYLGDSAVYAERKY